MVVPLTTSKGLPNSITRFNTWSLTTHSNMRLFQRVVSMKYKTTERRLPIKNNKYSVNVGPNTETED
jgi:hypothetical protein